MVVDDEPLVGRAVKRVLVGQADVLCVTSAREALEMLSAPQAHVDLVLCDLMMPDMTGQEFWNALRARHPSIARRLIFLTGGVFTEETESFLRQTSCPHLLKPFDVGELRSLVAARVAA